MSKTSVTQRVAVKAQQLADLAGITQAALARMLNITQATVSRKLKGEISFRLDELDALADALHTTVENLVTRTPKA